MQERTVYEILSALRADNNLTWLEAAGKIKECYREQLLWYEYYKSLPHGRYDGAIRKTAAAFSTPRRTLDVRWVQMVVKEMQRVIIIPDNTASP